jgi:hypothetical protein
MFISYLHRLAKNPKWVRSSKPPYFVLLPFSALFATLRDAFFFKRKRHGAQNRRRRGDELGQGLGGELGLDRLDLLMEMIIMSTFTKKKCAFGCFSVQKVRCARAVSTGETGQTRSGFHVSTSH